MRRIKTAGTPINCLLLLAITFGTGLSGQIRADQNANWYQIEVIIFSQQDLYQDEQSPTNITLQYPQNWHRLGDDTVEEQPSIHRVQEDLKLGPEEYTLNRTAGYRVLAHMAWRQPGMEQAKTPWIIVSGGHRHGSHHELEGSLRLVLNRHLHVQADLWKTSFASISGTVSTSPNNANQPDIWPQLPIQPWLIEDRTLSQSLPGTAAATVNRIENRHPPVKKISVLKQSKQVDLNELTYLDHPEMGVLVLVTRHTSTVAD
ncbi:CsiV family protein [Porticoccus sp.]|uniref:CsiV family protein n=1 Tax=Porticoccus sp. TaxID=2024853 RepID=UPI003F69E095